MVQNHSILLFVLLMVGNQALLSHGRITILSEVLHLFQLMDEINMSKNYSKDLETITMKKNSAMTNTELLEELRNVFQGISELKTVSANELNSLVRTLIESFQFSGRLQILVYRLSKRLNFIDNRYETFSRIYLRTNNSKVEMLENFFTMIISENTFGLDYKLKKIYHLMHGSNTQRTKLFDVLNQRMQDMEFHDCGDRGSFQRNIYNLFDNIAMREMKAYIMMVTAYLYLQSNRKEHKISVITANSEKRLVVYVHDLRDVMVQAPTEILRCGPARDGTDFIELKGSFQGIVVDDGASNIRCRSGNNYACVGPKRVPTKFATGSDVCMYQNENYCLGQSCYEEMTDCESIAKEVVVCDADPDSTRRYDYVKSGHEKILRETDIYYRNKTDHCYQIPKQGFATHVRAGYSVFSCSYCLCTCMGNRWKESDLRAISFLEQKADISESKTIVGVKFIEENGIVHLQIKQANVLSGGRIQKGSEEWKAIEKIERRFPSENPEIPPDYYFMRVNGGRKLREYSEYIHISKDFRTMSLSDVKIPKGYLITGVKLQLENKIESSDPAVIDDPIELQITATPFDFRIGAYTETENNPSIYITSSMGRNPDVKRRRIKFESPDVSIDGPEQIVYHDTDQLVDFRVTDYKKDAGQTVIPFFDARAVEDIPNTPLGGIGLYFKGSSGYGGFIAPKVFTLDVHNYFNMNVKLSVKYQITTIS